MNHCPRFRLTAGRGITAGPPRHHPTGRGPRPRTTLASIALMVVVAGCGTALAAPTTPAMTSLQPAESPAATPAAGGTTTPRTTLSPTAAAVRCSNAQVLATWSAARLAEQTLVVPVDQGSVGTVAPEVAAGAGGIILFGTSAPTALGAALRSLEASAANGLPPLVMTDEEGGAVQRMTNLVGSIPSARQMGASMSSGQIRVLASRLAARMRTAGVTMDLGPVLDVDGGRGPTSRDPDGTRSFSADARVAAADGLAFAAGLRDGGIAPVVKHFPGLGAATGNTDVMAASTLPWGSLQRAGMIPFEDAVHARLPAIMISNASVPGLTTLPSSVSHAVITTVLRQQLGYQGLVMTDSLSATALHAAGYSVPAAAVAAVSAGADMVLFTATPASVAGLTNAMVAALVKAVDTGVISHARLVNAVSHVLEAKGADLCG